MGVHALRVTEIVALLYATSRVSGVVRADSAAGDEAGGGTDRSARAYRTTQRSERGSCGGTQRRADNGTADGTL